MTRGCKDALGRIGYPAAMWQARLGQYDEAHELFVRRAAYCTRHAWPWQRRGWLEETRRAHRQWHASRALGRQLRHLLEEGST